MNSKKTRKIIVLLFILIYAIISFINIRGSYLQYRELGENYVQIFNTNLKYKYIIFGINFIFLYTLMYFTNRGISKGLKTFFDKEQKEVPKFPNKSISFITSVIISTIVSNVFLKKILLLTSNASFGITDNVFGFDIGFYIFQKPVITMLLTYLAIVIGGITLYTIIYYLIVFNRYFDGIDSNMLKDSIFIKKLLRNVVLIIIPIVMITILNTTNITLNRMLTIKSDTDESKNIEIIGAGYTDVMLQRWAHLIFAVVTLIFVIRAVKRFKEGENYKAIKNLAVIPIYLVLMFFVLIGFNLIFVNSNVLDKQKDYLETNIKYTKNAYNIDINEESMEKPETITRRQVLENSSIIDNIRIINDDVVLKNLDYYQQGTGYYSYRNANLAKYKISGKEKLVYISPREMSNRGRTYNNKTYEYTHGIGQIVIDGTETTQDGGINYIQKDISGKDDALNTKEQEIYFGLETNDTIATNTKNKKEYNYTDTDGKEYTSSYSGNAGLNLGFFDRLILGLKSGNLKLAFSSEVNQNSKILINRNIIKRAKQAMPFLVYDENPYTVVTDDGKIVWVLDAYTISSQYPYSQFEPIEHDGIKEKINYIRNSVKVIIDSYDGTIKFYLTDENDPIAMAYAKTYPTLFTGKGSDIPEDISEHFVYPKYLYNVQAELLKIYHNVKYDVLYRKDDLWESAKINETVVQKSSGTILKPYYTMIRDGEEDKIGLIQIYTPSGKQNLISYLVRNS